MFSLCIRVFFLCTLLPTTRGQQCKNDAGQNVDWFFAYKIPLLKHKNRLIDKGEAYAYITSKSPKGKWILSKKSVKDSTSMFGRTLEPLYWKPDNHLFLMYNDDPPTVKASNIYAHAKGVASTNGRTGFWLIHSCPRFPPEPLIANPKTGTSQSFSYPLTATKFGQSFLCISLPSSEMNNVGLALQHMRPKVYARGLPPTLVAKFPDFADAVEGKFNKKAPWNLKTPLTTLEGKQFMSYSKSKQFNKDLYSDWMAADLKSELDVETWSNGRSQLPSDCKHAYHTMDILDVKIEIDNLRLNFKNSKDHSKWMVTANSSVKTVCVGDINRMRSQYQRGGGTVCTQDMLVWKNYLDTVVDLEPCPL